MVFLAERDELRKLRAIAGRIPAHAPMLEVRHFARSITAQPAGAAVTRSSLIHHGTLSALHLRGLAPS